MALHLILALALLGSPFQDIHKRFNLDLPAGWKYIPQPGDTRGAVFHKNLEGVPAHLNIRSLKVPVGSSAGDVADSLLATMQYEPGYRLLANDMDFLGGMPGHRIRYVIDINGDRVWQKMVEDRFLVEGKRAWVVHFETIAEAFSSFEEDLTKVSSTFALGATSDSSGGSQRGALSGRKTVSKLVGRWQMVAQPTVVFEMKKDGSFDLAGHKGSWSNRGGKLITMPDGGGEESFNWQIDGNLLLLSGVHLTTPIQYRRIRAIGSGGIYGRWQGGARRLRTEGCNRNAHLCAPGHPLVVCRPCVFPDDGRAGASGYAKQAR